MAFCARHENLCIGCLIEAVRSAQKTIDIDNVNRVLRQPVLCLTLVTVLIVNCRIVVLFG